MTEAELLKNPFNCTNWYNSELTLALFLTKKYERILVGTKAGILERLISQKAIPGYTDTISPYNFYTLKDSSGKSPFGNALDTLAGAFANGIQHEKYLRSVQIPLVCDKKFRLGHFLLEFEKDYAKEWYTVVELLSSALDSPILSRKLIDEAKHILLKKWQTNDPVCQFAALKIWRLFCDKPHPKLFETTALLITDAFYQTPDALPMLKQRQMSPFDPILRLPPVGKTLTDDVTLWFLEGSDSECVVFKGSFYPLKQYYRIHMNRNGLKFCRCKECGTFFVSDTLKSTACRNKCRKTQRTTAKQAYERKNKGNELERAAKATTQLWRNRLAKADRIADFPAEQKDKLACAFEKFKSECKKMKKSANAARTYRISLGNTEPSSEENDFTNWLVKKSTECQALMGPFEDLHVY